MLSEIKKTIEQIYINKDYHYFVLQSQKKLSFIEQLLENTQSICSNVILSDDSNAPSAELYFDIGKFENGEFNVKYSSVLSISKICDVFYLQHEFAVENIDPNRMTPVLDGFGDEAYSKQQYELDNRIVSFLTEKQYKRLSYSDMLEVVSTVEMPQNSIFGTQMTVENALFKDLWNICLSD